MAKTHKLSPKIILISLCALLLLSGCQKTFMDRPQSEPTFTPTTTFTPTITPTSTFVPTITCTSTLTPTATLTPYPSLTPTPTATSVTPQPAQLPLWYDTDGRLVDWSYHYVTSIGRNEAGDVNSLSALLAFQLQDRSIQRRNLHFQDQDLTVYYLNVTHNFNGDIIPLGLVIGGAFGKDLPLSLIPADGSAYVRVFQLDTASPLDGYLIHRSAAEVYPRIKVVPGDILLTELEALLVNLPDELIVLADHPILFPRNDWQQAKLDMTRISAQTARYYPLFAFNADERIVEQSNFAYDLRDYLLNGAVMPPGIYFYPSQTLVLISP